MVGMTVGAGRLSTRARSVVLLATALLLTGACARTRPVRQNEAGPSATASGSAAAASQPAEPSGDQPPNGADNDAWKQRRALSAADRSLAEEAATRIRPALEKLRAARQFAPAVTRQALLTLGFPAADVQVEPMQLPIGRNAPQPPDGAVYAIHVGKSGCVIGDVRPQRVLVQVTGTAVEYGCLEPFSH
jgi:hypothetical protein